MSYDLTKLVKLEGLQQLANRIKSLFYDKEEIDAKLDTIVPIEKGGTGNSDGYIRTGQKSNIQSGEFSTAEGNEVRSTGTASHAEGYSTIASGNYFHAEGSATVAPGNNSHAEGSSTTASGKYSHAEGSSTTASGYASHAEGINTKASGTYSHAEGIDTEASGQASHAEGTNTEATGLNSHASGRGTIANGRSEFVFGMFNIADYGPDMPDHTPYSYIEIVGNGTANDNRSNARTLDWQGNEILAGTLTVGVNPTENMQVATKKYVDDHNYITAYKIILDYDQNLEIPNNLPEVPDTYNDWTYNYSKIDALIIDGQDNLLTLEEIQNLNLKYCVFYLPYPQNSNDLVDETFLYPIYNINYVDTTDELTDHRMESLISFYTPNGIINAGLAFISNRKK